MARRTMMVVVVVVLCVVVMNTNWVGGSASKRSIPARSCKDLLASPSPPHPSQLKKGRQAVCYACNFTTFPTLCATVLLSSPSSRSATPTKLTPLALNLALASLNKAYALASSLTNQNGNNNTAGALQDCAELMSDSKDDLSDSISRLKSISHPSNSSSIHDHIQDALVWTSAALTSQSTCSDGLSESVQEEAEEEESPSASPKGKTHSSSSSSSSMKPTLDYVGQMITNALDLVAHLETHLCSWKTPDPYKFPSCKKQ